MLTVTQIYTLYIFKKLSKLSPVSYTHLDVYKRQMKYLSRNETRPCKKKKQKKKIPLSESFN